MKGKWTHQLALLGSLASCLQNLPSCLAICLEDVLQVGFSEGVRALPAGCLGDISQGYAFKKCPRGSYPPNVVRPDRVFGCRHVFGWYIATPAERVGLSR